MLRLHFFFQKKINKYIQDMNINFNFSIIVNFRIMGSTESNMRLTSQEVDKLQTNSAFVFSTEKTIKEICYHSQDTYQHSLKFFTQVMQTNENENIIKLIKLWSTQEENMCSKVYKIFLQFQKPELNLLDQIHARKEQSRYFEEQDIWSIISSCVSALHKLKDCLLVHPSMIYIFGDGTLKFPNKLAISTDYRNILAQGIYYSPQKINCFWKKQNQFSLEKEAVFSFGMTILQAALLQNVTDCYDYKNSIFFEEVLNEKLRKLQQLNLYTQQLLQTIGLMLETVPNRRSTFIQLEDIVNVKNQIEGISCNHASKVCENENTENIQSERQSNTISQKDKQQQISQKQSQRQQINENIQNSSKANIQQNKKIKYRDTFGGSRLSQSIKSEKQNRVPALNSQQKSVVQHERNQNFIYKQNNEKISNTNSLFTDPKLLAMIRRDLREINQLKQSNVFLESYFQTSRVSYLGSQQQKMLYPQKILNQDSLVLSRTSVFNQQFNSNPKQKTADTTAQVKYEKKKYQNGVIYQGVTFAGKRHGRGKLIYQNGSYYEGEFFEDMMQGKGTLYYRQGQPAYSGSWMRDKFCGFGILYNQNAVELGQCYNFTDFNEVQNYWDKYEGFFINDTKQGSGTLYLTNGQRFRGQFIQDYITGQGIYYTMTGKQIKGVWSQNVLVRLLS